MDFFKRCWNLIMKSAKHWLVDNAQRMGAALAFYGILALPAILVTLIYVASVFYNSPNTGARVSKEINSLMGQKSGELFSSLLSSRQTHGHGPFATGVAVVVLIISATGVFAELQSDLNSVWGVEERSDVGWLWMIINRLFAFLLIIAIGILLVISVLVSTAIATVAGHIGNKLPGGVHLWHAVEFLVSCGIITVLFAMIFKFLPHAHPHWRDVWVGALVTAILFTIGKLLLGLYLGMSSTTSAYGVAGSTVLIMLWVYYSAQIFLYGAEFTQIYASEHGRSIKPSKQAMWKAEGQGALEDREEANTSGKPVRADYTPQPKPAPAAQTHEAPPHRGGTLGELAERVHSWHSRFGPRKAKA